MPNIRDVPLRQPVDQVLRLFERQLVIDADQLTNHPIAGTRHRHGIDAIGVNIPTDVTDTAFVAQRVSEYERPGHDHSERFNACVLRALN
jgi:hypothetical protein